ncbi:MAG: PhzF family phenazine biosynthesis protein [Deltaproteobacteria bacterium]|nr:PhzF family phenazine biosynthesis protein [Deltaproteobacteria bacterium]
MSLPIFQVDAFADQVFHGNPAAVCPLPTWLPTATLQAIAAENNLSETAFVVATADGWAIRWFTPATEVDLCGHATLAAAHVLFAQDPTRHTLVFASQSGPLTVARDGERIVLDFPSRPAVPCDAIEAVAAALGLRPLTLAVARDYLAVFASEDQVRQLQPDMARLAALPEFGLIATAPGRDCDFVSRYFAPREGVPEDPVTGSAHCTLVPYWARRLGKTVLHARQVSARGGELFCEDRGERVRIAGRAVLYLTGSIAIADAGIR